MKDILFEIYDLYYSLQWLLFLCLLDVTLVFYGVRNCKRLVLHWVQSIS